MSFLDVFLITLIAVAVAVAVVCILKGRAGGCDGHCENCSKCKK